MTTTRSRSRGRLAAALVSALTAGGLVALAPAAQADVAVTSGSLKWGFKQGFRTYVAGQFGASPGGAAPIAERIVPTAPATFDPADPAVPTTTAEAGRPYVFPATPFAGEVTSSTDIEVPVQGGVAYGFPDHGFQVRLSNLKVVVDGSTATIYADTRYTAQEAPGFPGGDLVGTHIPLATSSTVAVDVQDATASVSATDVTLTADGAANIPMYAAGDPLDDFTLTTNQVDAPTVTVSQSEVSAHGSTVVTVTGAGFDPALATGSRPPLAGQPAGAYVVFGKFAPTWKPSDGAQPATRTAATVGSGGQKWAVLAGSTATIGGANAGAITLNPDGSFTTQLRISKDTIDAAAPAGNTVYGIYTYPGSGASSSAYETFTPITFTSTGTKVALDAPALAYAGTEGETIPVGVTVSNADVAGTATGNVSLATLGGDGTETVVDTKPLVGGAATLAFPATTAPGTGSFIVKYAGDGTFPAASSAAATYTVKVDTEVTLDKSAYTIPSGAAAPVTVTVTRPDGVAAPTGAVTLSYTPTGGAATALDPVTLAAANNGVATFTLPVLEEGATGTLRATYAGNAVYNGATTATATYAVGKKTTQLTVTGPATVGYRTAATYKATLTNGATGTVKVSGAGVSYLRPIENGTATFVLPATLPAGARTLRFEYLGDATTEAADPVDKRITIAKGAAGITASITKKWTKAKAGKLTVKVRSVKGGPVPVGTVRLVLKKGKVTKTVAGKRLANGKVVLTLPKAAKGTWSVTARYLGSTQHAAVSKTWRVRVRAR